MKRMMFCRAACLFGLFCFGACGFEAKEITIPKVEKTIPRDATKLSLGNTLVEDAGLEKLKYLPQLTELDLGFTQVTDAGLVHLKHVPQLKSLGLGNRITDAGLTHLQHLKSLEELRSWFPRSPALGW